MYRTPHSGQPDSSGRISRSGHDVGFRRKGLARLPVCAAFLLLVFNCGPSCAEEIWTPDVPYITRQADSILRGKVLDGNKVRIEKQYKGEIKAEEITVPDLKKWSDLVKEQCSKERSYERDRLVKAVGEEAFAKFKSGGLVGSTVILFLEKGADENTYSLSGRTLAHKDHTIPHAAVKAVSGEKVLGFGQVQNPGPLLLLPLRQDLKTLEGQIAYERPFLLEFGACSSTGGDQVNNYLYFRFSNLTTERRDANLPDAAKLELAVDGKTIELPREFWDLNRRGESDGALEPGGFVNGHYELRNPKDNPPPSLRLGKGTEYTAKITIIIEKDGVEDKYEAEATRTIR